MAAVTFLVVGNTTSAAFFIRFDSRRSTPGGEIPQNLPRRRLRRLALTGFSRFCGNLALRTFQCSPLRGSAFQCCAYCSFCLQITPQRSLSATNRVQLIRSGDFAEPFPPPLRASLRARRSSLGRAPQRATRPLIPGRARPAPARLHLLWRSRAYAFRATLQKNQVEGLSFGFTRKFRSRWRVRRRRPSCRVERSAPAAPRRARGRCAKSA